MSGLKGAYILRYMIKLRVGIKFLYIEGPDGLLEVPLDATKEGISIANPGSYLSVLQDLNGYGNFGTLATFKFLGEYQFENRSELNEWLAAKAKGQTIERLEKRRLN